MPSAPIRLYDPAQENQGTAAAANTTGQAGAEPAPPAQE